MKQLKACKQIFILFFLIKTAIIAQTTFSGLITNADTQKPLKGVEIYSKSLTKTVYSDESGKYTIGIKNEEQKLIFIYYGFETIEASVNPSKKSTLNIALKPLSTSLSEVLIDQQKREVFGIKNLKNIEGTSIYAGKKTEVILIEQQVANKASGNPRQAYAQIAGLNIYETENAGLQLNIGGRGLNPNRSSNFNTRQNGYDISADVLGYPESYYSPPLEALDEIQIIRGAASLQYGTQFGGLVNFKLKKPHPTKKIEWTSRVGGGSFGLVNIFNSFSGTVKKTSYYAYHQYKKGNGFRPNSKFKSQNIYANLSYQLNDKTKIIFESTYLNYLAKQAGGLTDLQFATNPNFSNRSRNFFRVDWALLNLKIERQFNTRTTASVNFFTLNASREAIGFRDQRPSTQDILENPRELIIDKFSNWGAEARLLTRYAIGNVNSAFLIGAKYYQSLNKSEQGIGSNKLDADFRFRNNEFPNANLQESKFDFPNLNFALFWENIFNLSSTFSVTPGLRFEYINTKSDGFFIEKSFGNNNKLNSAITTPENRTNNRSFVLLGLGLSFKPSNQFEAFANFSQNYRSVTFNDIRIVSPNIEIDEDIEDETGYTFDIGIRGSINQVFRYDTNAFALLYNNRIGLTRLSTSRQGSLQTRTNLAKAQIFGIESLITANLSNWLFPSNKNFHWQHFLNTAYVFSEYLEESESNSNTSIVGNEVEFVPELNIKTGIELGFKNFKSSFQYSYIAPQFTNAENETVNSRFADGGVIGKIPEYSVMDLSLEYTYKKWKVEGGVNNLLNKSYFTQRATGYPGPGIIPSSPRNYYVVLQFQL